MQKLYQWEKRMILRLNDGCHPVAERLMLWATRMGNGGLIWILTGLALIAAGWSTEGFLMLTSLAVTAFLINLLIKPMFTRKRPYEIFQSIKTVIRPPFGSSFPSGHAASSFAAASMLWFMKVPFWHMALILAVLIALSRVYLLVHFPSDVLAGVVSGIIISYITYLLALRMGLQNVRGRVDQVSWWSGQARLAGNWIFLLARDLVKGP